MNEEAAQMIKELEEQNGGTIRYKTYALFMGRSGGEQQDLGGLLYGIDTRLIFEDFERQPNGIMQLINTKKPKYQKFKLEIPAGQITGMRKVMLNHARKAIAGKIAPHKVSDAFGLQKIFGRTAVELSLAQGDALYFELFDAKSFSAYMETLR